MPIAASLYDGRHDRLVRVRRDLAGGRSVHLAIHPDDAAEGRDRIGLERVPVRLDELLVRRQPDRVRVLDDRDRRGGVVPGDAIRRVEVEQVVERRAAALELAGVGERAAAVGRLAIERRPLMRVLAVAQLVHLLEHDREPAREDVAGDLVEVGGDLGVIGRDRAERLGRQACPQLRAGVPERPQLLDDRRVVGRVGDGRHPGGVPRGRAEERRAADIDHLDGLVEADELRADLRGERFDVDDHDVDRADALCLELGQLLGHVAPREDARIHGRVEGLDLSADERRHLGQVGHAADFHALAGQVLAGAVGGHDLDIEALQVPRERGDPFPVRD